MQYREERSKRIQIKGTSSERDTEQRTRRNMKIVRKTAKSSIEGRTVHEVRKPYGES